MQLPPSPAGPLCLLFLRYKQEPKHRKLLLSFPRLPNSTRNSILLFFYFLVLICQFSPGERMQSIQDWCVKAFYSTLLGSDCLTSVLAAGRFTEVMLWFKLVPVCDCFSEYIRTRVDQPELAPFSLWPSPSGIFSWSSPSRISFYI